MKTSVPIFRLKRKARLLSRDQHVPLHQALDRVAAEEGFSGWSLLAARAAAQSHARRIFGRLANGDVVLLGARPGHGKTLMSLRLAVEAMKAGNRSAFFSLEYVERDIQDRFRDIGADRSRFDGLFEFDDSDAISADHIVEALKAAPPGTLAVVDYLQLLDQQRDKPPLPDQIRALKCFARKKGLIIVVISQIDRSYDPSRKPCPDLEDVRLPNPLDLSLFDKSCFLGEAEIRLR